MLDRWDPRDSENRDHGGSWDRSFGSRGGGSEPDRNEECDRGTCSLGTSTCGHCSEQ
jgi:hypothetical protein